MAEITVAAPVTKEEMGSLQLVWRRQQVETIAINHRIPWETAAWWAWLRYLADERELHHQSRST